MSEENKKDPQAVQAVVSFNENGVVDFKNQSDLVSAAGLLIKTSLVPDHIKKDGIPAVMSAIAFCKQHSLPYSAMNEIGYVKGKLGAFGSLYTALAQKHPLFGETVVIYVDEQMNEICLANKNLNAEVWACVIRVKKKGDELWHEYYFTKYEAKTAGLLSNNTYQKYLKSMLYHRAKKRAYDTEYASALNGVESMELLIQERDIKDVSPLASLNERLGLSNEVGTTEEG